MRKLTAQWADQKSYTEGLYTFRETSVTKWFKCVGWEIQVL